MGIMRMLWNYNSLQWIPYWYVGNGSKPVLSSNPVRMHSVQSQIPIDWVYRTVSHLEIWREITGKGCLNSGF